MKVMGRVEAIASEGEHGAPSGWHLVRVGGQDILFQLGMSPGKVGDDVIVQCLASNIGLKALSVQKATTDITASNDYAKLCDDCREILERMRGSISEFVKANWELGRRIMNADRVYGEGTMKKLALDLDVSETYLYNCARVARKYPDFEKVRLLSQNSTAVENLCWRNLVKSTVETSRVQLHNPAVNPPATPQELVDAYRIGAKPLPEPGGSGPEVIIHQFLARLKIPYISEVPTETEDGKPAKPDFVIAHYLILENTNDLHKWEKDIPRDKGLAGEGRLVFRIHDDVLRAYRPPMEAKP